MGLYINSWNPSRWKYTRYRNGDSFLTIGRLTSNYYENDEKLEHALLNYAVFTCLLIIADVCAKADFYVQKGDVQDRNDPLVKLLKKPNFYQNGKDFIKQWIFYKLIFGYVPQRPVVSSGFNKLPKNTEAIYNLNPKGLIYPTDFKTPMLFEKDEINEFKDTEVKYRIKNMEKTFKVGDLMYTFDTANGIDDDKLLHAPSRIDAVYKSLKNIDLSLDAENIMLQTNGRELFSAGGGKGASGVKMPLEKKDILEIRRKLRDTYGLSRGQVRSIVTEGGVNWQSLHIALKDLGLLDSSNKNAATIRSIFQVPETIYKLYNEDGDTFENKKEGFVGFVQDVAQTHMDDFVMTLSNFFEGYDETPLKVSFDHLPCMQIIEDRKAEKFLKVSASILNLQRAGFSGEDIATLMHRFGYEDIEFKKVNNGQE